MLRLVALVLALSLPGLPLAQAGVTAKKPCAMHQAVKRLPCHSLPAVAVHDCCKNELRVSRDACNCGHGDEGSGVSREPSLAPKQSRFALVLPELMFVPPRATSPDPRSDPPDPRPPSVRS